jgi:hypothetical protein
VRIEKLCHNLSRFMNTKWGEWRDTRRTNNDKNKENESKMDLFCQGNGFFSTFRVISECFFSSGVCDLCAAALVMLRVSCEIQLVNSMRKNLPAHLKISIGKLKCRDTKIENHWYSLDIIITHKRPSIMSWWHCNSNQNQTYNS